MSHNTIYKVSQMSNTVSLW